MAQNCALLCTVLLVVPEISDRGFAHFLLVFGIVLHWRGRNLALGPHVQTPGGGTGCVVVTPETQISPLLGKAKEPAGGSANASCIIHKEMLLGHCSLVSHVAMSFPFVLCGQNWG